MFNNKKVQRYSIRKLTVGAASVLIGMAFLSNSNQAKADTEEANNNDKANIVDESHEQQVPKTSTQDAKHVVVNPQNNAAKSDTTKNDENVANKLSQELKVSQEKATNKPVSAKVLDESKVQDSKQQPTAKVNDQKKDSTTDPKEVTHKVTVQFINDYTGQPVYKLNRSKWAYEYVNPITGNFKDGEIIEEHKTAIDANGNTYETANRINEYYNLPGFVLLNRDEIDKAFPKADKWGEPIMSGDKDVDLTLHYAPLADTYIKYVDEATGKTLAHTTFPNTRLNVADARKGTPASRYEAVAINIPGYKLVTEPTIDGIITPDKIKTKGNDNPTVLVFKYKKVTPNEIPEAVSKADEGGIALSTTAWSALPGMFTLMINSETGKTITADGRDPEVATNELVDRYQKQGFTFSGISGKILSDDPYNGVSDGTNVHLIPNLPVTVNYVDEAGNKIAAEDTIAFNKNNPDQTNNGINVKENWNPEGEWSTKPKDIKGYDHVKTLGAENGKFTLFTYNVTYVYAKHVNGGIRYIDDTTKQDLTSAKFEGTVGKNINYTTADKIANFEKQGYKLVSNNFNDGKQLFTEKDNNFEVHFVHATEVKNDTKTITRVVNYVDENGKPVAGQVTETATISGSAVLDKVTNKVSDYKWGTADFKEINAPVVDGYHVTGVTTEGKLYYTVNKDNGNVAATPVTDKDGNTVVTVHFAKNATEGTVTYIDDTTKSTLKIDNLNGKIGDKINYTTADKIANFEKQGYELSKSNFQDGSMIFTKDGNNFELHFVHATDAKPESKTITRVINYVDENGNKVSGTVTQTANLVGSTIIDRVTGKEVAPTKWVETTFKEVKTPTVEGYHVTNVSTEGNIYYSIEKNGDVAQTSVKNTNGNTVVTVHFTKNEAPKPQPTQPQPTKPEPTTPAPTQPAPTEPAPTIPAPSVPEENVTPHPETPATPETPTAPVDDNVETVKPHATAVPEKPEAGKKVEETVKPHAATPAKKTAVQVENHKAELPQTSEENDNTAAAAGLALVSAITMIGLAGAKKRKN